MKMIKCAERLPAKPDKVMVVFHLPNPLIYSAYWDGENFVLDARYFSNSFHASWLSFLNIKPEKIDAWAELPEEIE